MDSPGTDQNKSLLDGTGGQPLNTITNTNTNTNANTKKPIALPGHGLKKRPSTIAQDLARAKLAKQLLEIPKIPRNYHDLSRIAGAKHPIVSIAIQLPDEVEVEVEVEVDITPNPDSNPNKSELSKPTLTKPTTNTKSTIFDDLSILLGCNTVKGDGVYYPPMHEDWSANDLTLLSENQQIMLARQPIGGCLEEICSALSPITCIQQALNITLKTGTNPKQNEGIDLIHYHRAMTCCGQLPWKSSKLIVTVKNKTIGYIEDYMHSYHVYNQSHELEYVIHPPLYRNQGYDDGTNVSSCCFLLDSKKYIDKSTSYGHPYYIYKPGIATIQGNECGMILHRLSGIDTSYPMSTSGSPNGSGIGSESECDEYSRARILGVVLLIYKIHKEENQESGPTMVYNI